MDYKKYSLENLENWLHDAISSGEATPDEVYDVIVNVIREEYYYHKQHASQTYELLCKLNGNGKELYDAVMKEREYYEGTTSLSCDKDDPSPECQKSWSDFWEGVDEEVKTDLLVNGYEYTPLVGKVDNVSHSKHYYDYTRNDPNRSNPFPDKVVKWQLPVEIDEVTEECFVSFPDDLLDAASLKEGDTVEWVDNNDGSYTLRKV